LSDWLASRWLVVHESSPEEIRDLLEVVDRDLADAALEGLSPDWRLGIAYNAALQLATLALAAEGFRPARDRAHERAIQALRLTVRSPAELVNTLDGVRRKRNRSTYERAGMASASEAEEVFDLAESLRADVLAWLVKRHPELLP
jgi:hypothetical protein